MSNVRVTVAGTFNISEKVRVPGRVGEEIELDVRVTRAGTFIISEKYQELTKLMRRQEKSG